MGWIIEKNTSTLPPPRTKQPSARTRTSSSLTKNRRQSRGDRPTILCEVQALVVQQKLLHLGAAELSRARRLAYTIPVTTYIIPGTIPGTVYYTWHYPRRLSSNHFLVTFPLTCMDTQHPNNVVDLMLFQLYCHLASNPNGNATSRRLSTRPDDLTPQVLVLYWSNEWWAGRAWTGCPGMSLGSPPSKNELTNLFFLAPRASYNICHV